MDDTQSVPGDQSKIIPILTGLEMTQNRIPNTAQGYS
jgi:hypothetical protein